MSRKVDLVFTAFSLPLTPLFQESVLPERRKLPSSRWVGLSLLWGWKYPFFGGKGISISWVCIWCQVLSWFCFFFFFHFVRLQRETYSVYKCEYRSIKILRAYSYQMMSPGSAQFADFKFYPCFHWTTLPPWVWLTPQGTGLCSFIGRLHTACLVQSLEACLFLPDISLTVKVIHSYYTLNLLLSGLGKANRIINCGACLHEHVLCVGKSVCINSNRLLNLSWRHEKTCYITAQ